MTQMIAVPYFFMEEKVLVLYAIMDKFVWEAIVAQEKLNGKKLNRPRLWRRRLLCSSCCDFLMTEYDIYS